MKGVTRRFRFEGQDPDEFPDWVYALNFGAGEGRLQVASFEGELVVELGEVLVRDPAGVMWVEKEAS